MLTNYLVNCWILKFKAIYDSNKIIITENKNVFGLSWIRDDATIKRMQLLNVFSMCGSKPLSVITIIDFTGHMVDDGKKDVEFIMSYFKSKVDEFDPELTDAFFLDVAANVQKAGQILCANFPQPICFHKWEHGLPLYFSDLSRIGAIKVCVIFFYV